MLWLYLPTVYDNYKPFHPLVYEIDSFAFEFGQVYCCQKKGVDPDETGDNGHEAQNPTVIV